MNNVQENQTELQDGFLKLFELKVNGVISADEEKQRKELIIEHLKSVEQEEHPDDDKWDMVGCTGCADSLLRQIYIFFRLIDPY